MVIQNLLTRNSNQEKNTVISEKWLLRLLLIVIGGVVLTMCSIGNDDKGWDQFEGTSDEESIINLDPIRK
jgi:hypothetical protein